MSTTPQGVTATETVTSKQQLCKSEAKFVIGYRLGVTIKCQSTEDSHSDLHVAFTWPTPPDVHGEPGFNTPASIRYTWPGEFKA